MSTPIVTPLLAGRYSARAYQPQSIPDEALLSLLEAARWAPSSYNDQPWSFIVARRQDVHHFERLLACLGGNQAWAKDAGVLLACVAAKTLAHNGKPNPHAWHDIGLAVMAMAVQGVSLGLQMREMAGIDRELARSTFSVPETHDVVTGLAIGYPLEGPEHAQKMAGRGRKTLREFVFEGKWKGEPGWIH